MRSISKILLFCSLSIALWAQPQNSDINKALEQFMILLEKSTQTLKDLSQTKQKVISEKRDTFQLYYKIIKNSANVEKRNDLLVQTQIKYNFLTDKHIPSSNILILVKNGVVELYGKVYSKESAERAIKKALEIKGVKEVVSYLIIKEPEKILL